MCAICQLQTFPKKNGISVYNKPNMKLEFNKILNKFNDFVSNLIKIYSTSENQSEPCINTFSKYDPYIFCK